MKTTNQRYRMTQGPPPGPHHAGAMCMNRKSWGGRGRIEQKNMEISHKILTSLSYVQNWTLRG